MDDYDEDPDEDEFDFGVFPGDEEEEDEYDDVRGYDDDHDDDEEDRMMDDPYDEYDFEEERPVRPSPRGSKRGRSTGGPGSGKRSSPNSRSGGRSREPSSSRRGPSPSRRGGRVVQYDSRSSRNRSAPQPGAFTRGLSALRESIPDPTTIKDSALSSMSAVKDTSSKLSNNLYREIKGLTSSELEQVMLKATQPNDSPVKGKHVERLVGVTYQISGRYDIYDSVLRKLWSKMVEKDWRTTVKALYILHRFSADGAPDHQAALKARLRELRRTRDPKRKEKFFNSKQLLAGDSTPADIAFRAFLGRYAHYVLLRAQCFGGMFTEIANEPDARKPKGNNKKPQRQPPKKPITTTCLKNEHLEAAQMLLKAGLACDLKEEEECENSAIAFERVVSDLIGLTTATATALNKALKNDSDDLDRDLIKKWCEFYSEELLPKTKSMVKSSAPTLDVYGLFLPSRMGASVSQDLLKRGLEGAGSSESSRGIEVEDIPEAEEDVCPPEEEKEEEPEVQDEEEDLPEEANEDLYDEYEYDEYEYDEY